MDSLLVAVLIRAWAAHHRYAVSNSSALNCLIVHLLREILTDGVAVARTTRMHGVYAASSHGWVDAVVWLQSAPAV